MYILFLLCNIVLNFCLSAHAMDVEVSICSKKKKDEFFQYINGTIIVRHLSYECKSHFIVPEGGKICSNCQERYCSDCASLEGFSDEMTFCPQCELGMAYKKFLADSPHNSGFTTQEDGW
jgi:hypothetical protein